MTTFKEKRSHLRVELLAQVQVAHESEVYIMNTLNISRGGVFLQGDPLEHSDIVEGAILDLVIFAADESTPEDVQVKARVARIEAGDSDELPPGFGMEFVSLEKGQIEALDRLIALAAARSGPPPLPPF